MEDLVKAHIDVVITYGSCVIIIVFALWAWLYTKNADTEKLRRKERTIDALPSVVSTLGVLGTFFGITYGLYHFNVNDLTASVPKLLDGLKTAFFTSLCGMLGSLLLRHLVTDRKYEAGDVIVSDAKSAQIEICNAVMLMKNAVVAAKAIDIADTATDVASMVSNKKMANRINKATQFVVQANEQYDKINVRDQGYGQEFGQSKGMVNSMVGFVTDKAWGKPQRRRAIHQYIDDTLLPVFKSEANKVSVNLTNDIRNLLYQESNESTTSMINAINELKDIRKNKQKEFEQRVEQLRDYKNELITL